MMDPNDDRSEPRSLQLVIAETAYAEGMRSYSGRGMSGESCLGVIIRDSLGSFFGSVMETTQEMFSDGEGEAAAFAIAQAFKSMRTDSMGRDSIVYFPGVPYTESGEVYEEEEV